MQLQPQITYAGGVGEGALTLNNKIIPTLFPKRASRCFMNITGTIARLTQSFLIANRNCITPAG